MKRTPNSSVRRRDTFQLSCTNHSYAVSIETVDTTRLDCENEVTTPSSELPKV